MVVLPWLLACVFFDLRSRALPAWLSIPPLLGSILWTALQGNLGLALLTLTLIALDDLPGRLRGFLGAFQGLLLAWIWQQSGLPGLFLGLSLLAIWLGWKLGAYGGADAQVLLTLVLIFSPGILYPIAVFSGFQGVAQWLRRKAALPAMLSILAGTFFFLLQR
jgi:hypothetical protein